MTVPSSVSSSDPAGLEGSGEGGEKWLGRTGAEGRREKEERLRGVEGAGRGLLGKLGKLQGETKVAGRARGLGEEVREWGGRLVWRVGRIAELKGVEVVAKGGSILDKGKP